MRSQPRLTRKMVLEECQHLPDGGGGMVATWVALGSHWCALRATSARERIVGERPRSSVTHQVIVRAAPEGSPKRPSADQRFRLGSRLFNIRGVADADPDGTFLKIWVEEGAAS